MIQIGGVYTTLCQEKGILLQKYRDRNGRCIAILFKSIGVRGRCDSPDSSRTNINNAPQIRSAEHLAIKKSGLVLRDSLCLHQRAAKKGEGTRG